jgi:hypothetical protein
VAKADSPLPKHEINALAICILPAIQIYFNTEAGRREFMEWAKNRMKNEPE